MFTKKDFNSIEEGYFIIHSATPFCIILESKPTGHYWWIEASSFGREVRLHHKHKSQDTWHGQSFYGCRHTVSGAVKAIKKHDVFVLSGRKLSFPANQK